tara:strand:+ start:860 stop:1459 length:600 start_codon:yes stop_codon:yes gene_type:complete
MVKFIAHRVNTSKEISNLNNNIFGLEADLRDYKKKLVLSHNPKTNGEEFHQFLKNTKKTIFLNIKSSGILKDIIRLVKNKEVYFLDISFSEINYLIKHNLSKKIILRFSCYENFDLNSKYFKKIKWIWYDYFNNTKISTKQHKYFKKYNKKICLVSPDLLGRKKDIAKYIKYLNKNKIIVDAVCVKKENIEIWKKNYNY